MADVFISYAHSDKRYAKRVLDVLAYYGLSAWIDKTGIPPGTPNWQTAIQNAIETACCVLVIMSPDAKQSVYVGKEIAFAEIQEKRFFPVLARGTGKDAVPFSLAGVQYVPIAHTTGAALYLRLQPLIQAIQAHKAAGCGP